MKTLQRYVLFELLQVFLLTLAGLAAFIFVVLIGEQAVDRGLGLGPLVRMSPYLLPQAMQFAVPGALLLATTSVYGRISASNEIIAAKSLGVSPWRLMQPTLALAVLVSLGAVALNDLAVSWGRMGVQRVFVESLEEVIYRQLQLHHRYAEGGVQINVRRVAERKLVRPTVTVQSSRDDSSWTVESASAEIRTAPDRRKLIVRFEGIYVEGQGTAAIAEPVEHEIDLADLLGATGGSRSPSSYALAEVGRGIRSSDERVAAIRRRQSTERVLALMTGEFERLDDASWAPTEAGLAAEAVYRRRLSLEPYRRWSNGFSCLAFVAVGAPMAIWRQKGEFLASFFMCFAPILLAYYPLLMGSVEAAKDGDLPPVAVWVGNVVLAIWGAWMTRRVVLR